MKRLLLTISCVLFLSAASPISSAAAGIRFWHRHHKDAAKTSEAPEAKAKKHPAAIASPRVTRLPAKRRLSV